MTCCYDCLFVEVKIKPEGHSIDVGILVGLETDDRLSPSAMLLPVQFELHNFDWGCAWSMRDAVQINTRVVFIPEILVQSGELKSPYTWRLDFDAHAINDSFVGNCDCLVLHDVSSEAFHQMQHVPSQ